MTRNLVLLAAAAALTGCASMDASPGQTASAQNAVYALNYGKVPMPAVGAGQRVTTSEAAAEAAVPDESKPMRVFWFFGGR